MQLVHSRTTKPGPSDGNALSMPTLCARAQFREWVERLSEPRHFIVQPEANRRAAEWIGRQLKAWGYQVAYQGRWRNVVALPPDTKGPFTLVCSHYDTVASTPGADDNASAVAGMLGCALALSQVTPRPRVGFVSFNREEDGLLGSSEFVAGSGITVREAHVLEMIGFASSEPGSQIVPAGLPIKIPTTGDFLGLVANRDSAALLNGTVRSARTYLPGLPVVGLKVRLGLERFFPVLLRSDHAPFWKARIPTLMWTDTSEFRNPHYHMPTDMAATLNYDFLERVTRLLLRTVLESDLR